ncbi:Uncharacterized protein SCF082_LOCUS2398 [Durusdinium trenchii]
MAAHLRRCMRLQLRRVPLEAVAAAKERLDAGMIDVVRVRADTDLRRLSGFLHSRFRLSALGMEEPIVIESMGANAIEKMVKVLAAVWARSAREHEDATSASDQDCAFHCYVEPQRLPSPGLELYSGVQCILLPVKEPQSGHGANTDAFSWTVRCIRFEGIGPCTGLCTMDQANQTVGYGRRIRRQR